MGFQDGDDLLLAAVKCQYKNYTTPFLLGFKNLFHRDLNNRILAVF
jgi:hypothetical protein